jgi:[acyl-carrier-protein] S-malonyltransferase
MKTAFVFPGQGSQFSGMGKDVAERFPVAREVFTRIDETLGFSISKICFEGSEDDLKLTANTQPAILAVSSALDAVLAANGKRPDVVAGHSLGEYSAIVAAGGLDAALAASIVRRRGEFMQAAVPVGEGAMAAIIGPSLEEVQSICDEAAQGDVVSPANINAPGQIVIAGAKAAVDRAIAVAKARGIRRALPLPVSAPFHCELMKPAELNLGPIIGVASFHELVVPLVNNVEARPVRAAGEVRDGLVRQVVSPVRWVESVERMIADGVTRFVEVGPGSVLAGLIKRINPDVPTIAVNNVETLESYLNS